MRSTTQHKFILRVVYFFEKNITGQASRREGKIVHFKLNFKVINSKESKTKIKLLRAYGGYLGSKRRRRTWPNNEMLRGAVKQALYPEVSEWGNPT